MFQLTINNDFSFSLTEKENVCKITINEWVLEVRKALIALTYLTQLRTNQMKNIKVRN